jgi:transcriptional regulator with XRE-family HTH domain
MTPNAKAIRALREVQQMSLRCLADLAQTSPSQLSRIERGLAGAGDDLIHRLAEALGVPVDDITRAEAAASKDGHSPQPPEGRSKGAAKERQAPDGVKTASGRVVPYPGTPEGAFFHYLPEEAADFLPWSALQLRRKAYAREVPFNDGGNRVTFTGQNICEISAMTAVRPLAETVQRRSA